MMNETDQQYPYKPFLPAPKHWEKIKAKYQSEEFETVESETNGWKYAYRCCFVAHALYQHFPQFYRINLMQDIWMIVIAMNALGRQKGDKNWLQESQKECTTFLKKELLLSKAAASKLTHCMGQEKPVSFKNLQCLLQDTNALVQFYTRRDHDFNFDQLHIIKGLGVRYQNEIQKICNQFIAFK